MQIFMITKNVSFFVVTNLTANYFGLLLLPSKVYADVINGLHYHVAKTQTKSELNAIFFRKKCDYKNRLSIKNAP